ncbi:hypothetical protein, conserved [Angomonas deanei]|uniref:NTF2 domain-containing protein n=1 Tax=Angomonas deanei TaxID=59799 RepID=A0A7G2CVA9_9TRYP|nr:hypothetical protein, conserved [Angomonas deanei]
MSNPHVVGISFAKQYYNCLVSTPSSLPNFYTPSARCSHQGQSAEGDVSKFLQRCYPHGSVTAAYVHSVDTILVVGAMEVTIKGKLVMRDGQERAFQQKVQLRQLQEKLHGIVADDFCFLAATPDAAKPATNWALDSPELTRQPEPAPVEEKVQLEAAVEPTATTTTQPEPEPEEEQVDLSSLSLAERLRLTQKKGGSTVVTSGAPVAKVVAPGGPEPVKKEAPKKEHKEKKEGDKKGNGKREAAKGEEEGKAHKEPANGEKKHGERGGLVYYDVMLKGLPQGSDEAAVRELIGTKIGVKLVKVESSPAKNDPKQIRTYAFVQLDQAELKKENIPRKTAIETVIEDAKTRLTNKEIRIEEVRERRGDRKSRQ